MLRLATIKSYLTNLEDSYENLDDYVEYSLDFSNPLTPLNYNEERNFNVEVQEGDLCYKSPFDLFRRTKCSKSIPVNIVKEAEGYTNVLENDVPDERRRYARVEHNRAV